MIYRRLTVSASPPSGRAGSTLIELMVVLVIVAVLLTIAIPGFNVLALRTKLKSYANEVVASAYTARSEAIKRNATMRLCISTDGSTCAGSGDWDQGWIVIDPNEAVINRRQGINDIDIFELSSVHTVSFLPSGVATTLTRIRICQEEDPPVKDGRKVRISATGRPTVRAMSDADETDAYDCNP